MNDDRAMTSILGVRVCVRAVRISGMYVRVSVCACKTLGMPPAWGRRPVIDPYGERDTGNGGEGTKRAPGGRVGPAGDDDPGVNVVVVTGGEVKRIEGKCNGVDFYVCHEPHVLR